MAQTKKALSFTTGTLISRLSGLAREMVLARFFGASILLDAYFVAYRIPNLFRDLLAEGALGSAFTKNYSIAKSHSEKQALSLISSTLSLAFLLTSFLCALGILYRKQVVYLLTTMGSSQAPLIQTTETLTAILFPLMVLSSLSAVMSGVLHQEKRFLFTSVSPVLLNLCVILGVLALSPVMHKLSFLLPINTLDPKLAALSVGTLLGGVAQLVWLSYPLIRRLKCALAAKISWRNQVLQKTIKDSLPMMGAASVAQLSLIINTNFATSLETGTVSWLNFAFRLIQMPVGLFAVAIATVILPNLAVHLKNHHQPNSSIKGNKAAISEISIALQSTIWLMLACSLAIILAAESMVVLLFYGGAFESFDVLITAKTLKAYGFGVVGYGVSKVLLSYIYAASLQAFALKVAILCLIISTTLNALWIDHWGILTLAAVSAGVFSLQAILLGYKCYRTQTSKKFSLRNSPLSKNAILAFITAAICAVAIRSIQKHTTWIFPFTQESLKASLSTVHFKWLALQNLAILAAVIAAVFLIGLMITYKRQLTNIWPRNKIL